jgi:trehalose 6-phosphate synthase
MAPGSVSRSKLVVVSNRLPYVFNRDASGRWSSSPGSGGLVTALLPVLRDRGGTWIGWPGVAGPTRALAPLLDAGGEEAGYRLKPVALDEDEVRDFYHGFANEIVWPLFHDLPSLCNFDPAYWRAYQRVNRRFAKSAASHAAQGDFVWVHDYHLMMAGAELRKLASGARTGFFLHIPVPSPDIFLKLPWRRPLLEGLLQFDLVGFQTRRDLRNFLACVDRLLPQARQ